MDVTEDLIACLRQANGWRGTSTCRCSRPDRVLAAMHRWYRADHYARRAELGAMAPRRGDCADVIAGFPGETKKIIAPRLRDRPAALTYLHVFSFSRGPGTRRRNAGSRSGRGDRARARELRAMGEEKRIGVSRRARRALPMRVLTSSIAMARDFADVDSRALRNYV